MLAAAARLPARSRRGCLADGRFNVAASIHGASSDPIIPPSPSRRAIWRTSARVNFNLTPAPMPFASSTIAATWSLLGTRPGDASRFLGCGRECDALTP